MEPTLLSWSTPLKSTKPRLLCRFPWLHLFLPCSQYKHGITELVLVVWYKHIEYIHRLRCILFHQMCFCHKFSRSTHSTKMVWFVALVACFALGFTHHPIVWLSSNNLDTSLYSPCTVAPSGGAVHQPPGDHDGKYLCHVVALAKTMTVFIVKYCIDRILHYRSYATHNLGLLIIL